MLSWSDGCQSPRGRAGVAAVGVTSVPQGLIANGFTETLEETRSKTRRRKVIASITIQRMMRGFVQRRHFKRLVRKVKAIKRIEIALESRDIEELLNAVRDAKYFVKGKDVVGKKKKKKKKNQFQVTKLRVENELEEKFKRAQQLVVQLQDTSGGVIKRRDTIDEELKSWKKKFNSSSPRSSERMRRRRRKRRGRETMSQIYEILSSKTTSDFVMILILLNLILVLLESVPSVKRRLGEEVFDILETISVLVFTVEYAARIYTAPVSAKYLYVVVCGFRVSSTFCTRVMYSRTHYRPHLEHRYKRYNFVSSFYGIVDFISIAPFYSMIVLEYFHVRGVQVRSARI